MSQISFRQWTLNFSEQTLSQWRLGSLNRSRSSPNTTTSFVDLQSQNSTGDFRYSKTAEPDRQDSLEDFAQWTHPVSSDWTHLAWVTGGAAGEEFYASFLREASFLALTPR